jgi:PEGA domain
MSGFGTMFTHSGHLPGSSGVRRFPLSVWLAFLLLLVQVGITSAASPATTTITTATTAVTTTTPEKIGGSIYFETYPAGAMIWLDDTEVAASPITYYSEKTGTLDLLIRKKGYENYTDKVTVIPGRRVTYSAVLTPLSYDITGGNIPAEPVATATTIRRSTIPVPTPWPTHIPESGSDPAVVIWAAGIGTGLLAIRRR